MKHHQRDRNRAPSEPAGGTFHVYIYIRILILAELLEAVRASMRAKVAALAEDNWMYEAEEEQIVR